MGMAFALHATSVLVFSEYNVAYTNHGISCIFLIMHFHLSNTKLYITIFLNDYIYPKVTLQDVLTSSFKIPKKRKQDIYIYIMI